MGVCCRGVPALGGGVLLWGSAPGGVPAPGIGVCGDPSPVTATAVGGTHPTGMHSCFIHSFIPLTHKKAVRMNAVQIILVSEVCIL